MKKLLLIIGIITMVFSLFVVSCSDDSKFEPKITTSTSGVSMSVITSESELSNRIIQVNTAIDLTDLQKVRQSSFSPYKASKKDTYYWELVVEMPVLKYNGENLSATQIEIFEDIAYVSYNSQGSKYIGAVEIIDLSNVASPKVISLATFDDIDINSLTIDKTSSVANRKIWLAGSRNKDGAIIIEITSSNGIINESTKIASFSKVFEEGISASANSICKVGEYLYITAGQSVGGLIKVNLADLSYSSHVAFTNAKYVISTGDKTTKDKIICLSTGENSKLRIHPLNSFESPVIYDLGQIKHANVEDPYSGKSTMFLAKDNKTVYIGMASAGLKAYNIENGQVKYSSIASMLTNGNTNSVSIDDDFVYMANGADGLAIALIPDNTEILPIFTWDLIEGSASANFVVSNNEYIFVAKGLGGVKILRKTAYGNHPGISTFDANGVPTNLAADIVVSPTLLPRIYENILPAGVNVTTLHPEYFVETVRNIVLTKQAELYVTFIDEGAGYRNVLGYYYYNKNTPPTSISELNSKVIFPNTSKIGSDGGLIMGKTMKLIGSFDENTVIGFYLISNGWNPKKTVVTDGYYTLYTNTEFNAKNYIQSVTLFDETSGHIILGFDDTKLPEGDKDYNDAIFQITSIPADAIDTSKYIKIVKN